MGKERIEKENHKEGFGMLGRKVDPWEQFKFKSFRSLYQAWPNCILPAFSPLFSAGQGFLKGKEAKIFFRNFHDTVCL
jgi:hypothetical protein